MYSLLTLLYDERALSSRLRVGGEGSSVGAEIYKTTKNKVIVIFRIRSPKP